MKDDQGNTLIFLIHVCYTYIAPDGTRVHGDRLFHARDPINSRERLEALRKELHSVLEKNYQTSMSIPVFTASPAILSTQKVVNDRITFNGHDLADLGTSQV
jgi:hypothetical protein